MPIIIHYKYNQMKYINFLALFTMVLLNYLFATIPLNNVSTGQVSALYPTLLTPAGYTFSIWSAIYLLLLIFVVMQLLNKHPELNIQIGWWFTVSCVLNVSWLIAWQHLLIGVSTILMFLLLFSLVVINRILTFSESRMAKAAFGLYLGWICVAAIANVSIFLVSGAWDGCGVPDYVWAAGMVLIAAALTVLSLMKLRNPFLALSVIWGLSGILLTRMNDVPTVALAAAGAIVIIASALIVFLTMVGRKNHNA